MGLLQQGRSQQMLSVDGCTQVGLCSHVSVSLELGSLCAVSLHAHIHHTEQNETSLEQGLSKGSSLT